MKMINDICNTYMVNTLYISLLINYVLLGFSDALPIGILFVVLIGEFIAIGYQMKHAFKMKDLLQNGEKIYYTSGMHYTKWMIPNRVNPGASGIGYTITIQDYVINKTYKTKVTIGDKRHCKEFEKILHSRPEIEVIVDNTDHPKEYYINLEELVKYTTCIRLEGIYENNLKWKCFFRLLFNYILAQWAWKHCSF